MTHQLDTSGKVIVNQTRIMWPDLTPFTQGALTAAFESGCPRCRGTGEFIKTWHAGNLHERLRDHGSGFGWFRCDLGFRDLAPETLARFIEDCEGCGNLRDCVHSDLQGKPEIGALVWRDRQAGLWTEHGFPPLTLFIADDGLIRIREGA